MSGRGIRTALFVQKYQIPSGKVSPNHVFASLHFLENNSPFIVSVYYDLLITTYSVLKVCSVTILLIICLLFVFDKSTKWPSNSKEQSLITEER